MVVVKLSEEDVQTFPAQQLANKIQASLSGADDLKATVSMLVDQMLGSHGEVRSKHAHILSHLCKFSVRDSTGGTLTTATLVNQHISAPVRSLLHAAVAAHLVATRNPGFQFYYSHIVTYFKDTWLSGLERETILHASEETMWDLVDLLVQAGSKLEADGCKLDALLTLLNEAVVCEQPIPSPFVRRTSFYLLKLRACRWKVALEGSPKRS